MECVVDAGVVSAAPMRTATVDRLSCLVRHWAWAHEAMSRFDREVAEGQAPEDGAAVDRSTGAFCHWCALLSGFSEAALAGQFLAPPQLARVHADLTASLSDLQSCRTLLMIVPSSDQAHQQVVESLRDPVRLARLRRLHWVFGDAIRYELVSREIDLLDD